jgi:hypothetical protein
MPSVIVHIQGEDSVLGDMEVLPAPTDLLIMLKNPRKRDGKDLHYLEANVNVVFWPTFRINFIEVLASQEEEEIISFVRER